LHPQKDRQTSMDSQVLIDMIQKINLYENKHAPSVHDQEEDFTPNSTLWMKKYLQKHGHGSSSRPSPIPPSSPRPPCKSKSSSSSNSNSGYSNSISILVSESKTISLPNDSTPPLCQNDAYLLVPLHMRDSMCCVHYPYL
jgi:hypothetical protein